jgi:hypothetical protein
METHAAITPCRVGRMACGTSLGHSTFNTTLIPCISRPSVISASLLRSGTVVWLFFINYAPASSEVCPKVSFSEPKDETSFDFTVIYPSESSKHAACIVLNHASLANLVSTNQRVLTSASHRRFRSRACLYIRIQHCDRSLPKPIACSLLPRLIYTSRIQPRQLHHQLHIYPQKLSEPSTRNTYRK